MLYAVRFWKGQQVNEVLVMASSPKRARNRARAENGFITIMKVTPAYKA